MPFDPNVEFSRLSSVLRGIGWEVLRQTIEPTRLVVEVSRPVPKEPEAPRAT